MLAIENGVDLLREAGMDRITEKSRKLSEFFIELLRSELPPSLGFHLNSPEDTSKRGSHVSVSHEQAYRITKALLDETIGEVKVVPDFRSPQNIRFGFAPLYNTFEDICKTIDKLKLIVESQIYTKYSEEKNQVT
jgi:kynureninase